MVAEPKVCITSMIIFPFRQKLVKNMHIKGIFYKLPHLATAQRISGGDVYMPEMGAPTMQAVARIFQPPLSYH